jgi:hypothetical protein
MSRSTSNSNNTDNTDNPTMSSSSSNTPTTPVNPGAETNTSPDPTRCVHTYALYWPCAHAKKSIFHGNSCIPPAYPTNPSLTALPRGHLDYPDFIEQIGGHNLDCAFFRTTVTHHNVPCYYCDPERLQSMVRSEDGPNDGWGVEVFSEGDKVCIRSGWERVVGSRF